MRGRRREGVPVSAWGAASPAGPSLEPGTLASLSVHFSEPRGDWTGGQVNVLNPLPCQWNDVLLNVFQKPHKYVLFYDDKAIYLDVFISVSLHFSDNQSVFFCLFLSVFFCSLVLLRLSNTER